MDSSLESPNGQGGHRTMGLLKVGPKVGLIEPVGLVEPKVGL